MKVRATIICKQDKLVLLVRKRGGRWTLPGGKLERGESAADAAVRELLEETGLRVDKLMYVLELESDGTRHHVFEVSVLNLEQMRPLNEITDCIWHPLDAVNNLNISDAMRSIVSTFVRRL